MRALAATIVTLAFIAMAAITYIAVRQDPMAGEPRLLVKIAPPDLAKLQAAAAPPLPPPATAVAAARAPSPPAPSASPTLSAGPTDEPVDGVAPVMPDQ